MAKTIHSATPGVMKAFRSETYGGSEQLKYQDAPLPALSAGHVVVKVSFAAVNPISRLASGFSDSPMGRTPSSRRQP